MPARHVNIIVLTACISFLCYVVHRRTKTALLVGDAISMIDSYYVDPVDSDQLIVSAMNGITQSLDDHSEFIAEQNYQAFQKINIENATSKGISNIGCIIKANAHANL